MLGRRLILSLLIVALIVPISCVSAQNSLTPNETQSTVHMSMGGGKLYVADLEAGSWTVIISSSSFWEMQFTIKVSLESDLSVLIAEVEGVAGQGVSLTFELDSSAEVYIRVDEIAVESGYYDIGVYNGLNAVVLSLGIWLFIIPLIAVMIIACAICKKKNLAKSQREIQIESPEKSQDGIQIEIPSHAIPERYREKSSGTDIRTVRIPVKCPSCGASLAHDNVDWTGPLEAECMYCGGVVRARLERL